MWTYGESNYKYMQTATKIWKKKCLLRVFFFFSGDALLHTIAISEKLFFNSQKIVLAMLRAFTILQRTNSNTYSFRPNNYRNN